MHEASEFFFYSIITFSYIKYFVHSHTVDVVFTLSIVIYINRLSMQYINDVDSGGLHV